MCINGHRGSNGIFKHQLFAVIKCRALFKLLVFLFKGSYLLLQLLYLGGKLFICASCLACFVHIGLYLTPDIFNALLSLCGLVKRRKGNKHRRILYAEIGLCLYHITYLFIYSVGKAFDIFGLFVGPEVIFLTTNNDLNFIFNIHLSDPFRNVFKYNYTSLSDRFQEILYSIIDMIFTKLFIWVCVFCVNLSGEHFIHLIDLYPDSDIYRQPYCRKASRKYYCEYPIHHRKRLVMFFRYSVGFER